MPEELVDSLLNYLKSAKHDDRAEENSIFLKTLDFAGQQVYEVLLPLFMSPKSIYILVYNLENDLDKHAQFKVEHGISERAERELENHFEMTNLETLEFWLSCISSYAKKGGESVGDRIPVASPPVFVTCTHADKCKEDPRRLRVAETLVKHLTRPENPCGKHVMQNVYTVDNTLSGNREIKDESVKKLKADVEELSKYLPHMDEYIPLNWLKFEEKLSNLVENEQKRYIDIEEARRIAKKCNINTAAESNEFATLLNYLHDLKSIIYFEETRTLFIDTQWLINMFVGVITVLPFPEWKDYADYWRKLEDEGVLQRALVEHVWKDIADDGQNTVDSLLLIMEKFSLICGWRLDDEEVFLVPCMLCNSERSEDINVFLADPKSSTMIIRFKSVHLPLGIFPRLVVAVAEHGKEKWTEANPELCPNFFRMYDVGEDGRFDICISSGIRTICISVLNNHNIGSQSVTHFCQSVRNLLGQIFDDMRRNLPWMENMEFEYGIRCPVCPTSKKKCKFHKMEECTRDSCLHFVSEKELEKDHPKCYEFKTKSDTFIKEEAYAHWFPKKSKEMVNTGKLADQETASPGPSAATCQELLVSFGDQGIQTIEVSEAATKVTRLLNLDKMSLEDPPKDIMDKCRRLCSYLKSNGRSDIVKKLRKSLPSGMTGPLGDGTLLVQHMDFNTKERLSRALTTKDEWKAFAEKLGVTRDDIDFYDKRTKNPVLAILNEHCGNMTVEDIYILIVESGANAIADYL